MKDVLRVGVAVPPLRVADVTYNLEKIRKQLKEAAAAGVSVLAFPELAIPGYTCGDLFTSEALLPRVEAALTALALFVAFAEATNLKSIDLKDPYVMVGLFIGAMLTFVFAAFTMSAVQRAAQSIVVEVRRQFREITGIMEGKTDPDYASCVGLCTKGALREMVKPSLLAIIVPILTGLILSVEGVVGLLGGVSVSGFAMAVFMSNAGGAWDNAKKYIEEGNHGGKGSPAHAAAVVGDTVGDPFKDTAGPSIHVLVKLLSTICLVTAVLFIA